MRYARFYGWPFDKNNERLARDFYDKVAPGIGSFARPEEFTVCLCVNANGYFIFVDLHNLDSADLSIQLGEEVKAFCNSCGCPDVAEVEYVPTEKLRGNMLREQLRNCGAYLVSGVTRTTFGTISTHRADPANPYDKDPGKQKCHCGSGKRYENCHGWAARVTTPGSPSMDPAAVKLTAAPPVHSAAAKPGAVPQVVTNDKKPSRWWQQWFQKESIQPPSSHGTPPTLDHRAVSAAPKDFPYRDGVDDRTFRDYPLLADLPRRFPGELSSLRAQAQRQVEQIRDGDLGYFWLAKCHAQAGELELAEQVLRQGLANCVRKSFLLVQLGELCEKQGRAVDMATWVIAAVNAQAARPIDATPFLYLSDIGAACLDRDVELRAEAIGVRLGRSLRSERRNAIRDFINPHWKDVAPLLARVAWPS